MDYNLNIQKNLQKIVSSLCEVKLRMTSSLMMDSFKILSGFAVTIEVMQSMFNAEAFIISQPSWVSRG